jgi:serine/threonine protein kinase
MNDYLKGLSFIHQKGIMHRDINPKNLAVTSLDDPIGVIIDLDSATSFDASTDHMGGTAAYLAPKIISLKWNNLGRYDKAVDVWALGLSMFAIHIGRRLRWIYRDHRGNHTTELVNEKPYEAYQKRLSRDRDDGNGDFVHLIKGMTDYDASKRFSTVMA